MDVRTAIRVTTWGVLILLLGLAACGRKGDPSPRRTPQDVHSKAPKPAPPPGEKP